MLVNFSEQWLVANTLYLEMIQLLNQKDGFKGNMRIGPALEVTTSFQHFKYGTEIRVESVNQDDSHSLGQNFLMEWSYVTDFIDFRCRGIKRCTSYSRTNDYVKLWLRHCVQLYAQQHHA